MVDLMLNQCLFFPLRTGCIIIGCIILILQLKDTIDALKILSFLESVENEDEENIDQRKFAVFHYTIKFIVSSFMVLVSVAILLGVKWNHSLVLKVSAVIVACSALLPTIQSIIESDPVPTYLYNILALVIYLFFGWVLWSYGVKLEQLQLPRAAYVQPP
ncbi:uncharacterized protein LOC124365212 [Homalodisca vitripennis]|uniref:uncharacterized protein LOC124365212 n=1 Tax=Homalodisca vitripennis TaxID=197043 RepID=UPI001EEA62BB|nr:uncharacterized protein LOC124365212 [Homalodisca vitripennis]